MASSNVKILEICCTGDNMEKIMYMTSRYGVDTLLLCSTYDQGGWIRLSKSLLSYHVVPVSSLLRFSSLRPTIYHLYFILLSILFHIYFQSIKFSGASAFCTVVKGRPVSDDVILINFKDKLELSQSLLSSETVANEVAVQLLDPSLYRYEDIYLTFD